MKLAVIAALVLLLSACAAEKRYEDWAIVIAEGLITDCNERLVRPLDPAHLTSMENEVQIQCVYEAAGQLPVEDRRPVMDALFDQDFFQETIADHHYKEELMGAKAKDTVLDETYGSTRVLVVRCGPSPPIWYWAITFGDGTIIDGDSRRMKDALTNVDPYRIHL